MKKTTKAAAICLSTMLAAQSLPLMPAGVSAADTPEPVYFNDFESGDLTGWANRGGEDTTEVSISTDKASSGKSALMASGQSETWNGPALRIDNILKPNTEYLFSAKVVGRYYTNCTLSWQYTDSDGNVHYANYKTLQGSDWQEFKDIKVSFTEEMTDVFIYFEGTKEDVFVDDVTITEVPYTPIQEDLPSLKDVYHDYFKIGTALTPDDMASKSFMALVEKHYNESITVGNQMKPDSVLDLKKTKANYEETGDDETIFVSFGAAKPILNYCQKNKIPVRIHTLVWHSQTPDWFFKEGFSEEKDAAWVTPEKMLKRMESYIKNYFETLLELYPDVDFYACDVVNEAVDDHTSGPREKGSNNIQQGQSAWVSVFGDNSFIEPAFTYARKYAPASCKLYYNDYNEFAQGKHEAILKIVEDLKSKNLIDGIGMQSHLDVRQGQDAWPSISSYEKAIKNFAETGLDIQITELDATIPDNSAKSQETQAQYYSDLFDLYVKYADKISAVIMWGVTDEKSWRHTQYPLVFDGTYQAKPAFKAIVDDMQYTTAASTKTTTTTTLTTTTSETSESLAKGDLLMGDVNDDGKVDVKDAVMLARYVGGDTTAKLSENGEKQADIDDKKGIAVGDLTKLLRVLAHLDTL